jgi:exodeoxyribonuclease VII large subunit
MPTNAPKIYTLTNLTRSLENHMDQTFGNKTFWVKAELSKVTVSSGRRYIELVDSEKENVTAKIQAIIWGNTYTAIKDKAGKVIDSIIQPGNKVLIAVRIQYDKLYGLKLLIVDLDLSYSFGDVEQLKKETILKLKKENIFANQHSIYLPTIAKRIGLISSKGTSGYKDFVTELSSNHYYTNFTVKEFNCKVQGKAAIPEIIGAIESANDYDIDVIVILRGGGSKIDLNIFNDYELCKAVCESKLPILTGIGHETDDVVADLVARKSLITPTALAKALYLSIATFNSNLINSYTALKVSSNNQLRNKKEEFNRHKKDIYITSTSILNERSQNLLGYKHYITTRLNTILRGHSTQLDVNYEKIKLLSTDLIKQQQLDLNSKLKLIDILNPERLLKTGYSISSVESTKITTLDNLVGKELKTETDKGTIYSNITKTKNNTK